MMNFGWYIVGNCFRLFLGFSTWLELTSSSIWLADQPDLACKNKTQNKTPTHLLVITMIIIIIIDDLSFASHRHINKKICGLGHMDTIQCDISNPWVILYLYFMNTYLLLGASLWPGTNSICWSALIRCLAQPSYVHAGVIICNICAYIAQVSIVYAHSS